ncbi:MAG TPA: hypothetical protein ENK33_02045 [Desulfobacterales bacterium]|nr:hypothetical protein [Desulfobacterales bacterium]
MNSPKAKIAAEIRGIYHEDASNAAGRIEEHLLTTLADYPPAERITFLDDLVSSEFRPTAKPEADIFTMLLGKERAGTALALSPAEISQQLTAALNTVFDSLNKLIGGINATLLGGVEGDETIRTVIYSSIDKEEGLQALEKHINQIGDFFAVSLQAFKEAARTKIQEILQELNPDSLAEESEGYLNFGPLRKAKMLDSYREKYNTLQNWQSSGLLLDAFVKEFEKNCQTLYLKKRDENE